MTLGCWHFEEISSLHFLGEVTDSILNSTGFWGTSEILWSNWWMWKCM